MYVEFIPSCVHDIKDDTAAVRSGSHVHLAAHLRLRVDVVDRDCHS